MMFTVNSKITVLSQNINEATIIQYKHSKALKEKRKEEQTIMKQHRKIAITDIGTKKNYHSGTVQEGTATDWMQSPVTKYLFL